VRFSPASSLWNLNAGSVSQPVMKKCTECLSPLVKTSGAGVSKSTLRNKFKSSGVAAKITQVGLVLFIITVLVKNEEIFSVFEVYKEPT
jgi:hypothetical protein